MLDLDTVTYDIERWMATFVEVPHPALGGWAPCPYARRARLDRDFEVRVGRNPFEDLISVSYGTLPCSVVIFAYDPKFHPSYHWLHLRNRILEVLYQFLRLIKLVSLA